MRTSIINKILNKIKICGYSAINVMPKLSLTRQSWQNFLR